MEVSAYLKHVCCILNDESIKRKFRFTYFGLVEEKNVLDAISHTLGWYLDILPVNHIHADSLYDILY